MMLNYTFSGSRIWIVYNQTMTPHYTPTKLCSSEKLITQFSIQWNPKLMMKKLEHRRIIHEKRDNIYLPSNRFVFIKPFVVKVFTLVKMS